MPMPRPSNDSPGAGSRVSTISTLPGTMSPPLVAGSFDSGLTTRPRGGTA